MREILFKGKRKDYGEWVEGSLIIDENGNYYIGKCVSPKTSTFSIVGRNIGKTLNRFVGYGMFMVLPETVGQYTGLKDKNGKMIFEGDVVRCWDTHSSFEAVVEFGNPNCQYNWGWQLDIIKGDKDANFSILLWVEMDEAGAYCEIIGNIHDNPELLKEGL